MRRPAKILAMDPATLDNGGAFNAATLFVGGWLGTLLEMDKPDTLWRDQTATLPARSIGVDTLGRIDDRSGNSNHAGQVTSSLRPLYAQDSIGRPICSWDLTDDKLDFLSALPAGPATMAVAYDPTLLSSNLVGLMLTSGLNPWVMAAAPGDTSTFVNNDTGVTGFWVNGVSQASNRRDVVYAALQSGSVMVWQWNTAGNPNMARIGSYSSTAHSIKFRKFMLLNRALTAQELAILSNAWR